MTPILSKYKLPVTSLPYKGRSRNKVGVPEGASSKILVYIKPSTYNGKNTLVKFYLLKLILIFNIYKL